MAKHPEKIKSTITTEPEATTSVVATAPLAEEESFDDLAASPGSEEAADHDPLHIVVNALYAIARGGSAVAVRNAIGNEFPDTRDEAVAFVRALERLRAAAEMAHSTAVETFANRYR